MREIKFRAWDRERNTMLYEPNGDIEPTWILHNNLYNPFCPDYELMQYTGLKDKNGIEIYEGDIVKWTHPSFKENKVEYKILNISDIRSSNKLEIDAQNGWLEVIGNVHENPELIK